VLITVICFIYPETVHVTWLGWWHIKLRTITLTLTHTNIWWPLTCSLLLCLSTQLIYLIQNAVILSVSQGCGIVLEYEVVKRVLRSQTLLMWSLDPLVHTDLERHNTTPDSL